MSTCSPSVHPRACGELLNSMPPSPSMFGSSPRMRGTQQTGFRWPLLDRFIPAHAGNSSCQPRTIGLATVHPRACGELISGFNSSSPDYGSSPRMRGTHRIDCRAGFGRRFIPAHAGNSRRLAGNHNRPTGSSPRMRGTRSLLATVSTRGSVHPRACGELLTDAENSIPGLGSSPRMRGTHHNDQSR